MEWTVWEKRIKLIVPLAIETEPFAKVDCTTSSGKEGILHSYTATEKHEPMFAFTIISSGNANRYRRPPAVRTITVGTSLTAMYICQFTASELVTSGSSEKSKSAPALRHESFKKSACAYIATVANPSIDQAIRTAARTIHALTCTYFPSLPWINPHTST